jgi:sulfate permease, SulP family
VTPDRAEPSQRALSRQIVAGLVIGTYVVSQMLAFAVLVFKGNLSVALGRGAGWVLVGLVMIVLVTTLTSSFRGLVAGPQDAPAVVLAAAAAGLALEAQDPIATLAAFTILTSALTGGLLIVMGRYRWGTYVRFVPFPVVAGFLGGTGVVLVMAGIDLLFGSAGGAGELWLRVIPGLAVGLLIVGLGRRGSVPAASVGIIAVAFAGYHASAIAGGVDRAEGIARGLLLGPFPDGRLIDLAVITELWSADWGALGAQLPAMAVMALVVPLALLLNTGALEHTFRMDIDVNRELVSTGAGLMAAAPFAGFPGYVKLGPTVIGRRIGGASRIPALICAGMAVVVLAVGADILSTLPVAIPAGLLLAVGLDFMLAWVWDVRRRVGVIDHAVIIAIVVTVAVFGFLPGVSLGVVAATVLFVVRYSRVPAIRRLATVRERRSRVQRSAADEAILQEIGDRVVLFELHGFLFFGTAEQMVQTVRDVVTTRPQVEMLIFDLHRVTGMDSSVAASFDRLIRLGKEHQLEIALSGASQKAGTVLKPLLEREGVGFFRDLDRALESCEEALLAAAPADDRQPSDRFWEEVPTARLANGTAIITEGQRDAGVFFLESGRAHATGGGDESDSRQAVLLAGSVIGELSHLSGGPATATVLCDTDCVVRHMSEKWLEDLAARDPSRALQVERLMAKRLADKLTAANRTIRSLE